MQVEAATLLRIVDIEQLLESRHHMLHVGIAACRGLDVEDFAGLIEVQTGRSDATAALALGFSGGLGLLVGFGEGAAEDPGSGDDDLRDNTVSLEKMRLAKEKYFESTKGGGNIHRTQVSHTMSTGTKSKVTGR